MSFSLRRVADEALRRRVVCRARETETFQRLQHLRGVPRAPSCE